MAGIKKWAKMFWILKESPYYARNGINESVEGSGDPLLLVFIFILNDFHAANTFLV